LQRLIIVVWLFCIVAGCASRVNAPAISDISSGLSTRSGYSIRDARAEFEAPTGVNLGDGVTEDEAIAVALWNHAGFQADLATLGFSRVDIIEAGMIRNPIFALLFPIGPKQLEATLSWPIEALWQRPRRLAAARLDADRVAQSLIDHGLDLVRDARFAHADLALANDRLALARDTQALRRQILDITEARRRAGDISEIEIQPARNDLLLADGDILTLQHNVDSSAAQLSLLLGQIMENRPFPSAIASPLPTKTPPAIPVLLEIAYASRPDMRASEIAIEAAGERARWQKSRVLQLTTILDANGSGSEGFEIGPGISAELFTVDRNVGGKERVAAELEQASRRYIALRHQIAKEVTEARIHYERAQATLAQYRDRILPPLEETARRAERAFAAGDVSRLFVLEATAKLLQARNQYIDIQWGLRRARAELERSVGSRMELS
jgi:cobalt-zinc-cadmium efflux system outer membrane protein